MPGSEGIIHAFGPLGKSADPLARADLPESFPPTCQDLMGIGLVSHVEDDAVPGRVIHGMQAHDELHGTKARAQVSRILCTALHHVPTDFRAQLPQLVHIELPDILRTVYLFQ